MQQINREQRQASARLLRQLPANTIKETTLPFDQRNVNKNFLSSSANRVDKSVNQQLQAEFDTQRSLSSCPTYLSLSRQSAAVDTRECGTQITTLTPTNEFEDEQDRIENSSPPIDNNQVFLIEDKPFEQVDFMPISSGFGYYPYNYPTTMTERVPRPQIISRAPQDSPIERSRQKRYVRVVRDLPYEEDDDVYYVEPPPPVRRTKVNRRPPPPTEYVYVDETPARVRSHRSRRPEVVYIDDDDDDRRVEYEDEYIYVDEHGNQVDYVDQRRKSPQYVEYIYEDELDRKRSQKPKIVYVDDDVDDRRRRRPPQLLPSKSQKKSKQPSSTRIVYD